MEYSVWHNCLKQLQSELTAQQFNTWIRPLQEMEKTREQAWCCGGGEGIVSLAYPQIASKIGNERIRQAQQTGATSIVTTCPHCNMMLNAASRSSNNTITCRDLSDLVAEGMGL